MSSLCHLKIGTALFFLQCSHKMESALDWHWAFIPKFSCVLENVYWPSNVNDQLGTDQLVLMG